MFRISVTLDTGVNSIVLQLLQNAICSPNDLDSSSSSSAAGQISSNRIAKLGSKRRSKKENEESSNEFALNLVHQINKSVESKLMERFCLKFLLECNSTSLRWQAHSLIVTVIKYSHEADKIKIVQMLWKLWPDLSKHGKKAVQFVDLLGYFSMKLLNKKNEVRLKYNTHGVKGQSVIVAI